MENDPLKSLISIDAKALDRKKIADFMLPFISIDSTTKDINFTTTFNTLRTNVDKIEVVLMSSKAKFLLFGTAEGMTANEIIGLDIMPIGSVKSSLNILTGSKKIKQDNSGRYYIPNYRIDDVIKDKNIKK